MTTIDNGTTWTGIFTPADNTTGEDSSQNSQGGSYNVNFVIAAGSFRDNKGNPGDSAQSPDFTVDTKAPSVDHVRLNDGIDIKEDTFTKADGTFRCIPVHSNIEVVFDYIMDLDSITANTNIHNTITNYNNLYRIN